MKNSLLIVMLMLWFNMTTAQAHGGFEQYFYASKGRTPVVVPVIYYQNQHDWYFESHANYEQTRSFSTYIGKTFSENKAFSCSFTPMLGGVIGSLNGGILGLNSEMSYKKIRFTSQSQYILSFENNKIDFLYNWVELGFQAIGHAFIGLSIQNTMINPRNVRLESGFFIRYNVKKWSFPVYCFNTTSEKRYLILGVAREFSFAVNRAETVLRVKP
jgi:hypothetical protein